jgi:hypothetical protein
MEALTATVQAGLLTVYDMFKGRPRHGDDRCAGAVEAWRQARGLERRGASLDLGEVRTVGAFPINALTAKQIPKRSS